MVLVTQKSIAQRFGVSPQYVNKLVLQGRIVAHRKKVDERQAVQAMKASGRVEVKTRAHRAAKKAPAKRTATPRIAKPKHVVIPRAESATKTQAFWKAQELEFKAKNAQLEYERNAGMWLARKSVLELEQRKNSTIKEKFRQLPRSLAQKLARISTPAEVEEVLRAEIDLVFSQLAADPLGMASQEAVLAAPAPAAHDSELVMPPAISQPAMELSV